jgi:hypothetical protein
MPMGVTSEAIRDMSIGGLRELNDIASKMVSLTTIQALQTEYSELEALTKAEILRREAEATVTLQVQAGRWLERKKNRDADNAKILKTKEALKDKNINIDIFPGLVSEARIYHLATVMEAADVIASKNKYLTVRPPNKVKNSELPSRKLKEEYGSAEKEVDESTEYIGKIINDKIEEGKKADRLARTVAIPDKFKVSGRLVDYGTFIYPGAGAIEYSTGSTYLVSPNRGLVHVRDELPRDASPALASNYLAALVLGCVTFIKQKAFDGNKVTISGFTRSGRAFSWNLIGKKDASQQGYAGEIYHIDSGYQNSMWRAE